MPELNDLSYSLACSPFNKLYVFHKTEYLWHISLGNYIYLYHQSIDFIILDGSAIEPSDEIIDESASQQDLFTSRVFSDITFIVEGKKIPAHKAVLCAGCRFFKNMFQGCEFILI